MIVFVIKIYKNLIMIWSQTDSRNQNPLSPSSKLSFDYFCFSGLKFASSLSLSVRFHSTRDSLTLALPLYVYNEGCRLNPLQLTRSEFLRSILSPWLPHTVVPLVGQAGHLIRVAWANLTKACSGYQACRKGERD